MQQSLSIVSHALLFIAADLPVPKARLVLALPLCTCHKSAARRAVWLLNTTTSQQSRLDLPSAVASRRCWNRILKQGEKTNSR